MDGDGSDFSFSSAPEYQKGQDATDISWADIFLDGIHSDDPISAESGGIHTGTSNLGASIHGNTHQMYHQSQPGIMGGQLQIHIPAQLQGSIANNAVQQAGTKLCGTVTYLTPSVSTHQHVNTAGGIHNMMTVAGHHQVASSVGQQQQQNSTKLVQIAPSFPVTQLPNSVPLQTLLQPNQTLTGQTIFGSQGGGLFPSQGSVHIENPKVVNVNFGPHVIGSDGSGQQTIFQTAEGKRVLITNSQLQQLSQSISLSQPLVGTQLINTAGGNVIRASLAPGGHTFMQSAATPSRQIVLPSGQTVIPQQTNNQHGGIAKNVVLRSLASNMSPVIYQSGQGGQLIHSQPTLITSSGQGLQVVNTGGGQGSQVQLIAPSMGQSGMGQQQGTVMNLINNSGVANQITGLVPGQNIYVNGQLLNFGQLGSLGVPQLHLQRNSQGGMTLTDINACTSQFQQSAPQFVIQQNGQQQQIVLQSRSNQSPSLMTNTVQSQRLISSMPSSLSARTPTPNTSSTSSTPVLTPAPSTPTPTPDLISDFAGGKSNQSINILKQALDMSDIDLQSFEDDISFLDDSVDCFSLITNQSPSQTPAPPLKPVTKPIKSKSKPSKLKLKNTQPVVNVSVNNTTPSYQQTTSQLDNTHRENFTLGPQEKIITANGQVYVLSANKQQLILQSSVRSDSPLAAQLKPVTSLASATTGVNRAQVSIPSGYHLEIKGLNQQSANQSTFNSSLNRQIKVEPHNLPGSLEQKNIFVTADASADTKVFVKTNPEDAQVHQIQTTMSAVPAAQHFVFTTAADFNNCPTTTFQSTADFTQTQFQHMNNKNVMTLSGTFVQQKPLTSVIKQETVTNLEQSVTHVQTLPHTSATVSIPNASLSIPTSSFNAMSTPIVISSPSFTPVVTTTTQSHQSTIMSTAQMVGSLSTTGTYTSHSSSTFGDASCVPASTDYQSPSMSPTLFHGANSAAATNTTNSSKSNSKEKDPANVKAMIPIKIADSTLMLSLTPGQKDWLENQLARMSKKDQEVFLIHQQNVIRRSQQVQQKQLEQQMKQQQMHLQKQQQVQDFQHMQQDQIQQFQQPQNQTQQQVQQSLQLPLQQQQIQREQIQQFQQPQEIQRDQIQQFQPHQEVQRDQTQQFQQHQVQQQSQQQSQWQPQQTSHLQTYYPTVKSGHPLQVSDGAELLSSQTGQAVPGLPTTVQELMEKSEDTDVQMNFQSFSAQRPSEQSQQLHYTPPIQQSEPPLLQQQHMYTNLQQRTVPLSSHSGGSVQQFGIPQIGRCLAEQQLLRDRSLAVDPDVNSPFKSLSDAMRRLVRYHTLQDHKPEEGSKTTRIWDTRYSKLCDYLVKKKRCYLRRFNKMKLYQDMCPEKQPEHIQNLICFNEQLRELIASEKERGSSQPDIYDPAAPGLSSSSWSSSSTQAVTEDASHLKKATVDCAEDRNVFVAFKHTNFDVNTETLPDHGTRLENLETIQPSSRKRTAPDKGSSGMLKLVFKRRTTDFTVKNSLSNVKELPRDLRPVVNLEKSDSEYEFDSNAADVMCNQPVIVRRRTLSVTSRQTSFDAGSDNCSVGSHAEEIHNDSYVQEESDDEEEDEGKSSGNDDENDDACEFIGNKRQPKHQYHVSFGGEVHDSDPDCSSDTSDSVDNDSFIESDVVRPKSSILHCKVNATNISAPRSFLSTDDNVTDIKHLGSRTKSSHHLPHTAKSNDIFNSTLSYSHPVTVPTKDRKRDYNKRSVGESVGHRGFSLTISNDSIGAYVQSAQAAVPDEEVEYVSESPVSTLEEEAARKGLPSSSLFTVPNKNLLETDAMFNSEDDDDVRSGIRTSKFEIDNKDPQSSMIDDSVRSVINSVLNDDGDDDDDDEDDKGSQTSWVSSTSSSHRSVFQS